VASIIAGVGLVRGRLEDDRAERRGNAHRRGALRAHAEPGVDRPLECLGAAVDRDHRSAPQFLPHLRSGVVGDQHVDHVSCAGDEVDRGCLGSEPMRSSIAVVKRCDELIAEGLESERGCGGEATGRFDVEHHVDVACGSRRVDAAMDAVELCHQPADQGPCLVREDGLDLCDVRPRWCPSARRGGDVDGAPVSHVGRPGRGRVR
jgi:hypothetical protein